MADKRSRSGDITIYDIAEQVGVSPSTVSRALAGSSRIGEKTKAKIIEAARAGQYSGIAGTEGGKKLRRLVEVVFPLAVAGEQRITDPFYLDMLAVVADGLAERNFNLVLINETPWARRGNVAHLPHVAGMIIIGHAPDQEALQRFGRENSNLVVWGARVDGDHHLTVGSDNVAGGRLATEHLLSLGRRRVAFIGDPAEPEVTQRQEGYLQALKEWGAGQQPILFKSPFNAYRARIAAQAAVASSADFDAIFCGSDVIALNVIDALRSVGRRVPEDVAVVGYDDISLASAYGQSLTTVSQQIPVGGQLLVDVFCSALAGEKVDSKVIPPKLQVRESTISHKKS
ncbi:LacI family transcriptional regulator [Parvularcula flava]|uniref:LacI family transcriptional regulator n=1 Tax=Aquisalinus luteolus TaxID=1566827 RepID=A0A8J3A140_9PROT|nr:LacI family DNA-binding transcriptional regulator [Aquisalinus luteolus]NHK26388.1 LacI family transcriptional regulator [Aquisalinus luteolus]GGH92184.1 LacI family transcriptional regulator [Aquisalinus luteolus]